MMRRSTLGKRSNPTHTAHGDSLTLALSQREREMSLPQKVA